MSAGVTPELEALLAGGGDMADRIRAVDWTATPLGPSSGWPQSLRSALSICLHSNFPIAIYWGPELRLLYNDSWAPVPGLRHPHALGRPAHEVWPDIWPIIEPQLREVMASGRGFSTEGRHLPMTRSGRLEESYWDYSFTPIAGEDGLVAGVLNQGVEVTDRVFERRRHSLLLALADQLRTLDDPDAIMAAAVDVLGPHLGAARVGYADVNIEAGTFGILYNWLRDEDVPDTRGAYQLGAFGDETTVALRAGHVFAVDDALIDERIVGRSAETYATIRLRSGLIVPVTKGGAYTAAIFVHDDRPRRWTEHHETLLSDVAERVWQATMRARAARALRESERRHRLIFEQANDIIFTVDLAQTVTAANPAAAAALGTTTDDLVGRSIAEFIASEDFDEANERLRRKLAGGGTTRFEVALRTGLARDLRWEISSTLAVDDDGRPIGLHAIARDITERHAFEQSQQRLIAELNHRVKNMLAQVQGLAFQSFKGERPPAEAQAVYQARIAALASAHDLLSREKWEGVTLGEIVADAIRPLADRAERVQRGGPPITLAPKTAVSLAMAFHELATNLVRHGALSDEEGRLDVRWSGEGDRLVIEWRESGGPPVVPPARRGFGLRMVERALSTDLAAKVALDFAEAGFACTIDAPLPAAARAAA